ncbi:MAG: hypothetical protein ACM3OO_02570, partial [Planctomycetaceae bacterium]
MRHRLTRRLAAALGALVVTASLVGTGAGASASARTSPLRRVGHVDPMRAAAAATRASATSDASIATDPEWYAAHRIEGQEPKGGGAVLRGDAAAPVARTATAVATTSGPSGWEGLNHFDSRYSGGGNQFSGEPPDQGLCASGTRVFEIVNSVIQVYDTSGHALISGTSFFPGTEPVGIPLNAFFGEPPQVDRSTGVFGPDMFDVSCRYDAATKRWFATSAWLALDPTTGAYAGPSAVFIAASDTANPLKGWTVWKLDTTNNGQNGTPDDGCSSGFCIGDYPQLGVDGSGLYVSTNEFDFLGQGEFHGAQLYAFSKADLIAGLADPTMVAFGTVTSPGMGDVAYTLQPVDSQPASRDTRGGGTMYFGMSNSPYSATNATSISLFRVTNTSSLGTDHPSLAIQEAVVGTEPYTFPSLALQADGPTPLLDCENSFPCIGAAYPHQDGPIPLDGGTGKVYGAWLRKGVVYLTVGTSLAGPGGASMSPQTGKWKAIDLHTGVAYVAIRPSGGSAFSATRVTQGYLDVPGENLTYPSVAINASGAGAISFTLVGPDFFPSAAYVRFRPAGPVGDVVVSGPGQGPNDGFTGYGDGGFDPRWGDYGAATVAPGGTVWFASEYVDQTCTSAQWSADPTCGYTRTFYANWSPHVTGLSSSRRRGRGTRAAPLRGAAPTRSLQHDRRRTRLTFLSRSV